MSIEARSRMISFRLTQDEFERCRELCFRNSIRSVSEMARVAITLLLEQPSRAAGASVECRLTELEAKVQILALDIRKFTQDPESV